MEKSLLIIFGHYDLFPYKESIMMTFLVVLALLGGILLGVGNIRRKVCDMFILTD